MIKKIFLFTKTFMKRHNKTCNFNFLSAKIEGEEFFDRIPGLCRTIASICTISCVGSLGTIAILSFNRYVFICQNKFYHKIFKKATCTGMCLCLYAIGTLLVLLNLAGVGGHSFDRKSLDCIWDRMVTYVYTVVVSVALFGSR